MLVLGVVEDDWELGDFACLHECQCFEHLIERVEVFWYDHERLCIFDEHRLVGEEVLEVDFDVYLVVELLFEG